MGSVGNGVVLKCQPPLVADVPKPAAATKSPLMKQSVPADGLAASSFLGTVMKKLIFAALMATTLPAIVVSTPVAAQSSSERYRFDEAQRRFDRETTIYEVARNRYERRGGRAATWENRYRQGDGYNRNIDQDRRYADQRDERGYDAAQYYREDARYQERTLASDDRVYRGNDGRYYCKRNDGTTGLIVGAVGGGILGNVIDGGHSRAAGTLIGGALGALAGREVERSQSVRCR
jgi:hypothetical protein